MPKVAPRLYKNFRPEHYDLLLDIDPDGLSFSGRVVISGKRTGPPAKRIVLHAKDLKVTGAKLFKIGKAEEEIAVSRTNIHKSFDELRIHTRETLHGGSYRLVVEFNGKITDAMHGIYPCYFDQRKKKLIGTQFESHHAREAFPCIDEPEAKATFDLSLSTPKTTVISNTPIREQVNAGGKLITTFETTPKMSTYLLAFVVGEVVYKEAHTKSGVKVRAYGTPANKNLLGFALETGVRCIDFFEGYFGVEYPMPKLDMIGLPDFSSGAMENWGLITFRESIFFVDSKSTGIETKQFTALVVNHELAHQWFGNLVTMKWWNDLWLNESFATLMEYIATDAIYPEWRIWEFFVNNELNAALRRDALPNVQAIRTKVNHPDELATLFDPSIVYAKGAVVLNMLRHYLGDDAFRRGLKIYFDKHRYANTEADDLWAALGQASNQNVGQFMDKWLTKNGYPVVDIKLEPDKFSASQKRLVVGKTSKAASDWPVPLRPSGQDEQMLLRKAESIFKIKPGQTAIFFNDEGRSYFVPRYVNQSHSLSLTEAIKQGQASTINRQNLLVGQTLLEKALLVKNVDNLELLKAYENETEETVWGGMSVILAEARRLIVGDEEIEAKLNRLIIDLVAAKLTELGWDAKASDSAQTLRLRNLILTLAAAAEDHTVITEALKRFAKFKKPADLAPDVRDVVYYAAVRFGKDVDFKRLVSLYQKLENADERNEIAGALTTTRKPAQIKQLLSMIKTSSVRSQDVATWYIWLLRNFYARTQAWQWLQQNWEWIQSKFASDKSYDNFPSYSANAFSRAEELEDYKKFFLPKRKILALERAIDLGIEEIEARVSWRQHNEQDTKDWLAKLD